MRWLFVTLVLIIIFAAFKSAEARNDYLNDRNCERGRVELYTELDRYDMINECIVIMITLVILEKLDYVLVGLYRALVIMIQ